MVRSKNVLGMSMQNFFAGGTAIDINAGVAELAVGAFSFVVTYAIASVIDATMGLRVDEDEENEGLDQGQHAESAYTS